MAPCSAGSSRAAPCKSSRNPCAKPGASGCEVVLVHRCTAAWSSSRSSRSRRQPRGVHGMRGDVMASPVTAAGARLHPSCECPRWGPRVGVTPGSPRLGGNTWVPWGLPECLLPPEGGREGGVVVRTPPNAWVPTGSARRQLKGHPPRVRAAPPRVPVAASRHCWSQGALGRPPRSGRPPATGPPLAMDPQMDPARSQVSPGHQGPW